MSDVTFGRLHWSDILVIALYYAGTIAVGIWSIRKTESSLSSFFLASRSITWWPVGLSLFASNIGSINFVGIAGTGAASGLAVIMFEWNAVFLLLLLAWVFLPVYISASIYTVPEYLSLAVIMFEWNAVFLLLLLAWVFLPVYISSGIYTVPEYLSLRFGGQRLRIYLSVIAILSYIFAIMSVDLYSGALFIRETMNLNIYIGVAIILVTTFLFTTMGGLLTVVFTDAFSVIVMVLGGFVLFVLGMIRVGGLSNLERLYMASIPNITHPNSTCGYPREDALHIFRHPWTADFPAIGTFLRTSVMGSLWFWCCNQMIVQRSLAAKNIVHAKAGSILASYLKLTPLLIMVFPGMIARAIFPNEVGCATPETCREVCGNPAGCSNIAYPRLAVELLPRGLRGLMIAAMIAAVISSLTSIFNSTSSIVTMDLWRRFRPRASERELLIVGKAFLVVLTVIAVVWIPVMDSAEGGQIYKYSIAANGTFGGPTCALFILAILWGRINEKGAFWGMLVGQAWGLLRFILEAIYSKPLCNEEDRRPFLVSGWHISYHICSQVVLTMVVAVAVSFLTKPLPAWRLAGTTYWTIYDRHIPEADSQPSDHKKDLLTKPESEEIPLSEKEVTSNNIQNDKLAEKTELRSCDRMRILARRVYSLYCVGNDKDAVFKHVEYVTQKPETGDAAVPPGSGAPQISSLKQSTQATVLLNVNAGLVALITVALYIYFR